MSNTEFYLEAGEMMRKAMNEIMAMGLNEAQRKAIEAAYIAFDNLTWECANTPKMEE